MRHLFGAVQVIPQDFPRIKSARAVPMHVCPQPCTRGAPQGAFDAVHEPRAPGSACAATQIQRPLQPAVAHDSSFGPKRQPLAKILIVDDDSAVQATIRLLLERAGHSVVVANDGRNGLAIFEAGDFDLLFLDIFMPGMDGLETMRLVHQQRPLIPIIVISGNPVTADSGPDFLTMATKLGAVRSLQKPFKPAALLAAVAGCLEAATPRPSPSIPAGDIASSP
jgi:CheY-like chemotaxis protein